MDLSRDIREDYEYSPHVLVMIFASDQALHVPIASHNQVRVLTWNTSRHRSK